MLFHVSVFFNNIYENIGPRINKTIIDITLPKIAAESDWVAEIPIVNAENTVIASEIPKPAGVIATRIPMDPIDDMNKQEMNVTGIPNTWNWRYIIKEYTNDCKIEIIIVVKITFLLFLIKCQPFITLMNLLIQVYFVYGNWGEKITIEDIEIKAIRKMARIM